MKKKAWIFFAAVAFVVAGGLGYFLLHREDRAGNNLARLLPPGLDMYVVADLRAMGINSVVQKLAANPPGMPHDADYDRFIRESGFRYEKNLRQIAIGKSGPDWIGAARVDIDRPRLVKYLESAGANRTDVSGYVMYTFGRIRPFRLMLLDEKSKDALVALSIGGDSAQMLHIVERLPGVLVFSSDQKQSAASELEGEKGLDHIPAASKVWMVARPEKLWGTGQAEVGSLGISTGLLRGSRMIYGSIEPGIVQLNFRVEDICDNSESARRIANSLRGLLALLRATSSGKTKPAAQPQSLLEGISVEDVQQTVVLHWQWDERVLEMLQSSAH